MLLSRPAGALIGLAWIGLFCALASCGGEALQRPNVLLISIDTLRADRLGAYGYGRATSPWFDELSRESVLFENAFSNAPGTAPSHMSLMTGVYQETHGIEQARAKATRLSERLPTLASHLQQAGYRTAAITGGGNVSAGFGFDQGMDSYAELSNLPRATKMAWITADRLARTAPRRPFFLFFHTYEVHAPYVRKDFYRTQFTTGSESGAIPRTSEQLRAQVRRVNENGERPARSATDHFLSTVDRSDPAELATLSDLYDEGIRATDDQLAVLFEQLEQRGVLENTIVIVLSDHGEEFLEHGELAHRYHAYQELLHVPLLIRLPDRKLLHVSARRVASPVRLIDVVPTVLEVLELPRPRWLAGESLLGALRGEAIGSVPIVWSSKRETAGLQSLRVGAWKMIRSDQGGTEELFDLESDPGELQDRSSERPAQLGALREKLESLLAQAAKLAEHFGGTTERRLEGAEVERLRRLGYL